MVRQTYTDDLATWQMPQYVLAVTGKKPRFYRVEHGVFRMQSTQEGYEFDLTVDATRAPEARDKIKDYVATMLAIQNKQSDRRRNICGRCVRDRRAKGFLCLDEKCPYM